MKNLAGNQGCDAAIIDELQRASITLVHVDRPAGEVPSRLRGQLGPIILSRAWAYWSARGPVPLAVALELYEHPLGRRSVRVFGHCGCPPPDEPWISWLVPYGNPWIACLNALPNSHPVLLNRTGPSTNARPFVDRYDIDTQDGLELFARTLRKHGLDRLRRAPWYNDSMP